MTAHRDPVSIILPTREWGPVCSQLHAQLTEQDELFIVCDTTADPVASIEPPENVEVLIAGEPESCSGKANAVAYGMEHATNDRFIWTDDDFEHGEDWVDTLVEHGQVYGPATAIPMFYGNGWWALLESWSFLLATLSFYLGFGLWGGNAWGGGVTFTRDDVDVDQLTTELRTVVSDDGLLSRKLGNVYPIRSMITPVEVPGDYETVKHRMIRFLRLTHVNEGLTPFFAIGLGIVAALLVAPLPTAGALTGVTIAGYLATGVRRGTWLLTVPMALFIPVLIPIGMFVKTFRWGGRTYILHGKNRVAIADS